jgi:hypothetical protein
MEQVDLKRLIAIFFAVSITILAYQYITEYFFKSPTVTTPQQKAKKQH